MINKNDLAIVATVGMIGLAGSGLVACNDSSTPTSTSTLPGPRNPNPVFATATTSPEILAAMERAIQDEYHAENVYLGVISDFGDVWPFSNIVNAETRHSQTIAGLFRSRGIAVPQSQWSRANTPRFETLAQACKAAARAEQENIAIYDGFLKLDLPRDVRNVFTNNRRASLNSHLPAFQDCDCDCRD